MNLKPIKCSILFIFLPFLLFAANDGERVEKIITREFTVQSNARVELLNKYGNIDIAIGPSNKVRIEINISVTAGSRSKAMDMLERISVDFEEGNNRVRAETNIDNPSGFMSWFRNANVDMQIHYQVQVPPDVYLDLTNKFGNIYVETANRDMDIDLGYGDLRLGDVNAKLNLDMAYSEGSISLIQDGDIVLAYSDIEMEDGNNVTMEMKYSDVNAGTVKDLRLVSSFSDFHAVSVNQMDYEGKYDDVQIGSAGKISARTGFTDIKIEEFNGTGNFDMRYGDLRVRNIQRSFSGLDVNTSYTNVVLAFRPETAFSIDAVTNYCGIAQSGLKVTENIEKATNKVFKASKGSGGATVTVRMNYGDLRIE